MTKGSSGGPWGSSFADSPRRSKPRTNLPIPDMQQATPTKSATMMQPIRTKTVYTQGNTSHGAFGFTRQEVTRRTGGYRINSSLEIQNLGVDDFESSLLTDGGGSRFVLQSDEYVVRVDVFKTISEINALRLHTNKRVSRWYGRTRGDVTRLVADPGYCINIFQTRYGPAPMFNANQLTQLGVVFVPVTAFGGDLAASAEAFAAIERSDILCGGKHVSYDNVSNVRLMYQFPPRAIVGQAENWIRRIEVLSGAEHDRYVAGARLYGRSPSEFVFELEEGEVIEAVGGTMLNDKLAAISFKTNIKTIPWFGQHDADSTTWWTCETRPGSCICGFQVKFDGSDTSIGGFGVVYDVVAADAAAATAEASKAA